MKTAHDDLRTISLPSNMNRSA